MIKSDMLISEVLEKHSGSEEIFLRHGMRCLGCPMAKSETIEQAAAGHGVDADKLVSELNEFIKQA